MVRSFWLIALLDLIRYGVVLAQRLRSWIMSMCRFIPFSTGLMAWPLSLNCEILALCFVVLEINPRFLGIFCGEPKVVVLVFLCSLSALWQHCYTGLRRVIWALA